MADAGAQTVPARFVLCLLALLSSLPVSQTVSPLEMAGACQRLASGLTSPQVQLRGEKKRYPFSGGFSPNARKGRYWPVRVTFSFLEPQEDAYGQVGSHARSGTNYWFWKIPP